ncbi:NapC/NirT cytochrome c domain protein, partial [Calderihabitans maritimus]
FVTFL